MGKHGFGIIGAGMIAHVHAKAIASMDNAMLVGVYSPTAEKRKAFAAKEGCKDYDTLEAMLADPDVTSVCICTPSGIHEAPALQCMAAGRHVMIEKPMEITLEKCDRLIETGYRLGLKVGVIFPSRFYEGAMNLKQAIDSNKFGELVLGDAYVKWHRTEAYYRSNAWRGTWEIDGGGALMNQGIHSVDLLQWYMGPVESVQAFAGNRRHKSIAVEDTTVAALQFANGAMGTIEASTAVFPGDLKKIEILGTEGTAILEESNLIKWEFKVMDEADIAIREAQSKQGLSHGGGASNPADISFKGHLYQLQDFAHAIDSNGKPMVDGEEGRKSVAIIQAIYESARSGKLVRV